MTVEETPRSPEWNAWYAKNLAERKNVLITKLNDLKNKDIDNDTNYKFMNLVRSRLVEENIPLEDAVKIVANLEYDLTEINEDDDYVGDVALAYAEFAARVYDRLKSTGWHRHLTDQLIRKYFSPFNLYI